MNIHARMQFCQSGETLKKKKTAPPLLGSSRNQDLLPCEAINNEHGTHPNKRMDGRRRAGDP
jgi:hypothetical protein